MAPLDDGTTVHRPGIALNGFRTYDPWTGSYLQVDPLVDSTWSTYVYADSDPVGKADDSGLSVCLPESCTTPLPGEEGGGGAGGYCSWYCKGACGLGLGAGCDCASCSAGKSLGNTCEPGCISLGFDQEPCPNDEGTGCYCKCYDDGGGGGGGGGGGTGGGGTPPPKTRPVGSYPARIDVICDAISPIAGVLTGVASGYGCSQLGASGPRSFACGVLAGTVTMVVLNVAGRCPDQPRGPCPKGWHLGIVDTVNGTSVCIKN